MEDAVTAIEMPSPAHEHVITSLYPSPGRKYLNMAVMPSMHDELTVHLIDLSGKKVLQYDAGSVEPGISRTVEVPIQTLPSGMYLMTLYGTRTCPVYRSVLVE